MNELQNYINTLNERIAELETVRNFYKVGSFSYKYYGKQIKVIKSTIKSCENMMNR